MRSQAAKHTQRSCSPQVSSCNPVLLQQLPVSHLHTVHARGAHAVVLLRDARQAAHGRAGGTAV